MLMGTFIKVSGGTAKPMDLAFSLTPMEVCMKDSGWMTNSMDLALSPGTTIKSSTLETSMKVRNLETADSNLRADITRESLKTVNFTGLESTTFQILANFTRVNLNPIIWTEKALWFGQMNQGTREILSKESDLAKEPSTSRMETTTSVNGRMTYNMAQACCIM
jgi:hypothetical protein